MTNFLQREFKSKPQVRGQFPERPDERGADDHDRGSAYISPWERLSAATERVMGATGRSRDEVRTDICRAIADGAVKIQGKLGRHTTRPYICNMVLPTGAISSAGILGAGVDRTFQVRRYQCFVRGPEANRYRPRRLEWHQR